jgi:hypothetical protein
MAVQIIIVSFGNSMSVSFFVSEQRYAGQKPFCEIMVYAREKNSVCHIWNSA